MSRPLLIAAGLLVMLAGCQHKKKISLSGEEPVAVKDFIEFFQPLNLPFVYADSSLQKAKKENDSLLISLKIFNQFVPDSFLAKIYGKGIKPKLYAMGKVAVPKAETYLFVKSVAGGRKSVLLLAFDKKQQYLAGLAALRPDQYVSTTQTLVMDRRYSITKTLSRRNPDGTLSEGKDVYALNEAAKSFTLIMTEALEDRPTELINPIDTLPKKNKYSGDYTTGKMNLVSVRDGRRSDRVTFFIHFEKSKECTGELKGEAFFRTPNTAEYNKDGDPCKLKFIFSGSSVTLKEEEGCGSYRPLNCSFNGSFPKKKENKKKIK